MQTKTWGILMNCKHLRRFISSGPFFLLLALGIWSSWTLAQDRGSFKSPIDESMTMDRVSVLPFTDNLQGIYARPLEAHLISLVDKMHRWNYVPANATGPILTPEELEASPAKALKISESLYADGFFAARVTKGPNGVGIHLSFFLARDGKLLAQAILKDYSKFEISDLKERVAEMLAQISGKLPYSGRVLSRDGQRVTINLGARDGVQPGQVLSVIQFLSVNRHPKFNFLISTEKEIIGKVKVLKAEETLSFATVVAERERGTVQKNAKLGNLDFVSYGAGVDLGLSSRADDTLDQREDSGVAFGKDPRAWRPIDPASIGQVGVQMGLSRFNGHSNLVGVGSGKFSDSFAPMVHLDGELWVTPQLTFHARLRQGIIAVDNPRPGSTPTELNMQYSYYEGLMGYTFRFGLRASSPFVEPVAGIMTYKLYTDTSTPDALSTMQYSGFLLGLKGGAPIGLDGIYGAGGEFLMSYKPSLSETPASSGAGSENTIIQFGVYGYKRLSERLKAQVNFNMDMYSSTFSGTGSRATPATSTSHRYTTLVGGLFYMF